MAVADGYSSWIASRCNSTTTKTSTVTKKYTSKKSSSSSSSSNDGYSNWINERLERLRKADETNKSLINSLLGNFSVFGISTAKTSTTRPKTIDELIATGGIAALRGNSSSSSSNVSTKSTVKDGYSSWIADRIKKQEDEKNLGKDIVDGAATVGASVANASIGIGTGALEPLEKIIDMYTATNAKLTSGMASVLGNIFRFIWF